jgi:hypothetical protein
MHLGLRGRARTRGIPRGCCTSLDQSS